MINHVADHLRLLCSLLQWQASKAEVVDIQDTNWKVDSVGGSGQQLALHLLLRVVADVGIVGLPNAGVCVCVCACARVFVRVLLLRVVADVGIVSLPNAGVCVCVCVRVCACIRSYLAAARGGRCGHRGPS